MSIDLAPWNYTPGVKNNFKLSRLKGPMDKR